MYPLIYIFVSEVKNRLFLLWREGLLRARGLGARLRVVCPSVADTLLAASFCSLLKQHRQQLHPLTLLVRLDGCCLATVLMGAASVAATGEPDVVAALMQAENMRPNAWCMLTSWVNGSARPSQTTLARQSQLYVISLFLQWGTWNQATSSYPYTVRVCVGLVSSDRKLHTDKEVQCKIPRTGKKIYQGTGVRLLDGLMTTKECLLRES